MGGAHTQRTVVSCEVSSTSCGLMLRLLLAASMKLTTDSATTIWSTRKQVLPLDSGSQEHQVRSTWDIFTVWDAHQTDMEPITRPPTSFGERIVLENTHMPIGC